MTMENSGKDKYKPTNPNEGIHHYLNKVDAEKALYEINDETFEGFVKGVISLYTIAVEQEQPDILLAPWRGAGPLVWTMEVISKRKQASVKDNGEEIKMPIVAALPIGTSMDYAITRQLKGMKGEEKTHVIEAYLKDIYETYGNKV